MKKNRVGGIKKESLSPPSSALSSGIILMTKNDSPNSLRGGRVVFHQLTTMVQKISMVHEEKYGKMVLHIYNFHQDFIVARLTHQFFKKVQIKIALRSQNKHTRRKKYNRKRYVDFFTGIKN